MRWLTVAAGLLLAGGTARAQSAATCQYDAATATVTVSVDGVEAQLQAIASTGEIRLDGVSCAGATVGNTDAIQVVGGALDDVFTLTGAFTPGRTAEADGSSEIEISFALNGGADQVLINLRNVADRITFTSAGLDVGGEGDEDLVTAGVETLTVNGLGGNDVIDASAYTGAPRRGLLDLRGGPGDDRLTGSMRADALYGDDGDDVLHGGNGNDDIDGGNGMDDMYGEAGDDWFYEDAAANGSDLMSGGSGPYDRVSYRLRTSSIYIDRSNDVADEGEVGENDAILASTEMVYGGRAADVMIGSGRADYFYGMRGDDEIYGGRGDDTLDGGIGNDLLVGDEGDDNIAGGPGDDFCDLGLGGGSIWAGDGNDELTSGGNVGVSFNGNAGDDRIHNGNAVSDTVYCEAGIDQADPDPLDVFVYGDGGCEVP